MLLFSCNTRNEIKPKVISLYNDADIEDIAIQEAVLLNDVKQIIVKDLKTKVDSIVVKKEKTEFDYYAIEQLLLNISELATEADLTLEETSDLNKWVKKKQVQLKQL